MSGVMRYEGVDTCVLVGHLSPYSVCICMYTCLYMYMYVWMHGVYTYVYTNVCVAYVRMYLCVCGYGDCQNDESSAG